MSYIYIGLSGYASYRSIRADGKPEGLIADSRVGPEHIGHIA